MHTITSDYTSHMSECTKGRQKQLMMPKKEEKAGRVHERERENELPNVQR